MEKLIEKGGKEKVEILKCSKCGNEIVYRYESGRYDAVFCPECARQWTRERKGV